MELRFLTAIFIILLPQVLLGQYHHLATPADGSVVYFDTDYPRTGTEDARQGRIFTIDGSGLQIFAERQREDLPGIPLYTNYYQLSGATVSSDSAVKAFLGVRQCSGKPCGIPRVSEITIQRLGLPDLHTQGAGVQLSTNGRYALLTRGQADPDWRGGFIDITTGVVRSFFSFPSQSLLPGRQIADDATVVSVDFGTLELIRGAERQTIRLFPSEFPEQAVIDPAAKIVVYTSRWAFPNRSHVRIRAMDLTTGTRWTLIEDFADFYQPVLSDDGRQMLFLTNCRFDDSGFVGPPQAYVMAMDGTGMRPLTSDLAGIREAVLSGNGKVAYAVSRAGRLLRIDIESGETRELLPRTLAVTIGYTGYVAGSPIRFFGVGYPAADGKPEPVTVRMGDMIAPVTWSEPGELVVQVPWELAGVFTKLTLGTDVPPAPFVPPAVEFEWIPPAFWPQMEPLPDEYGTPAPVGMSYGLVLRADSRVVSVDSPAHPGETVRAVVIGLGPVDPPLTTGQPAPLEGAASVVRTELSCWTWPDDMAVAIPVVAATMAPGAIGIYHLDLMLPLDLPPGRWNSGGTLGIGCTGDLFVNMSFEFPPVPAVKVAQ